MIRIKGNMKENWKKNEMYYLAFLLPFLAMLIIFIGNLIYPFGNNSFLNMDMYHQYFPFMVELYHKVKEGESLAYSWNAGLGLNFVVLYAYYLASPLNWLCLLLPEQFIMEFMSYFVVVKTGLCGLTAAIYLSKHFQVKNKTIVLFSTFYAMSGFMAAYNWDVMWLDCVVLAPLIILGLENLVKEGKYKLYCITLALAILSNYYLCIMICIYLVLYFFIVLFPFAKNKGKVFLNFCWTSLLAGGMGSLFLIPAAFSLQLSKFGAESFPETVKTYFSIFDMISRHMMAINIEHLSNHWPNLYCSVAVFILVPLFLMAKNISTAEKISKGLLLLFMLISFSVNVLDFLWHGYNYPNSLPARQSFLYILLMLTTCYEVFIHLKSFSKQELTAAVMAAFGFIILNQKLVKSDAITDGTYLYTLVFILLYSLLIYIYIKYGNKYKSLIWLTILVIFVEASSNMAMTSVKTVVRSHYFENYATYNELWQKQSKLDEKKFYRYDKENHEMDNDSMLHDYPSTSLFSSASNSIVNHYYNQFGMRNSKVVYGRDGMTPLVSSLLSVGYTFSDVGLRRNPLYLEINKDKTVILYKNKYSLPLGYSIYFDKGIEKQLIKDVNTVDDIIESREKDRLLPIQNQNILAMRLGTEKDIFDKVCSKNKEGNVITKIPQNGNVYAYLSQISKEVVLYVNGNKKDTFMNLHDNYILDLGYIEENSIVELKAENGEKIDADVYILDEAILAELINQLSESTLEIQKMEADYILGTVSPKKDGYLIMSIPYDPGFIAKVDGVETELKLFEEMMLAIPLTAGTHEIELNYKVQGMNLGIAVSVVSILFFVGIVYFERKKKKKQFNEMLATGLQQAKEGESVSVEEAFSKLRSEK